ncbi:MAG TPA: DUF5693 family protein [Negativicutes bacterium]|nr:DUF5693 family protein [Negativicutes bacterium]
MLVFRYNRILISFIAIGLVAALFVNWQRYGIERVNTQVELVSDYEEIVEMARIDGVPLQSALRQLKTAGLTSLAIFETNLERLASEGVVTAVSTTQMLHSYHAGTLTNWWWRNEVESGRLAAGQVYVLDRETDRFAEVQSDLERRVGARRIKYFNESGRRFLIVDAPFESLIRWNLGLPTSEMQTAASNGFLVLARPTNYLKVNPEDVKAVFDRIDSVGAAVSGIYFVGEEVLGFPDQLPLVASEMNKRGITLAMMEHYTQLQFKMQDGMFDLAKLSGYSAARLHQLLKVEQPKLSMVEAVHRQVLGSRERNIRLQYLKMYERPLPGKNLTETHVAYVSGVKQGLDSFGVPTGPATTFAPYRPNPLLLFLITLGTVAAGVLLISVAIPVPLRLQYGMLIVLSLGLGVPLFFGAATLVRQMTALGSAVLFPVLAMTWQLDCWRSSAPRAGAPLWRILRDGITGLARTSLLSLVGGAYLAAVLADTGFLLEMEIFRGVKMTFVLPLLLISIVYLTRFNLFPGVDADDSRHLWARLLHVLDYPAYIKTILGFGAAAAVAYVFVGRSGHDAGVPVPEIEIKLRRFLEVTMYARPREKEFLIGHPAFLMAVMALYRNWPRFFHFAFVVAATIAQGSLVETFAHMRTPVIMSLVRGANGLLLGALLGVAAVLVFHWLQSLTFLVGRRLPSNE